MNESDESNMPPFIGLAHPLSEVPPQKPEWDATCEAMRWLNDIEAMQGGRNGPSIKLRTAIEAMQAEQAALLRIKEAADVLYSEAEEYDLPDGLGMGTSQQYWDDLADALFPDDSGEVIQADLENVQAAVDGAWEAFNEELNKPEFLPCGHHHSMMLKSAETGEPLYCELCDCISRKNDAEMMESEAAARHRETLTALANTGKKLAAAQAERDEWKSEYFRRHKDAADNMERALIAEAEAAALRVDAERLNSRMIQMHSRDGNEWLMELFTDIDLRAAIDAAIEARKEGV